MAIVYIHKIKNTNIPFYVGISKNTQRAYDFNRRSKFWKDFTKKYEFVVEILCDGVDYDYAKLLEMQLIKQFGRRDLGEGTLVNLTDGGDGALGHRRYQSIETKLKISKNNAMHRDEVKLKHKESLNRPETKQKQQSAKLGTKRPKSYCKHCDNYIADNNFAKYHGDKCKMNKP